MKTLKLIFCVLLCAALLVGGAGGCAREETVSGPSSSQPTPVSSREEPEAPAGPYVIGVLQYGSDPDDDAIREAFMSRLEEWGCSDDQVSISYQNAEDDSDKAKSICKKFVEEQVDLIVPISSPASEIAVNAAWDADTAVVFAGIRNVPEKTGSAWERITGVNDGSVPAEKAAELALQADPGLKTFGLLYDGSDSNAQESAAQFKAWCGSRNIQVEEAAVSGAGEIPKALKELCAKADALFTPMGDKVYLSAAEIAKTSREAGKPWYADSSTLVCSGALAAVCVDREQIGRDAADLAFSMISGKYPGQYVTVRDVRVYVNQTALNALQTTIPEEVLSTAFFFEDGAE